MKKATVRREDLPQFLKEITQAMQKQNAFFNVSVKDHKTRADCVVVIIG